MIEKKLRSYIMPNVLAMIGTSCYVLADTFFISVAEGANGITALNLALPIYAVIFGIGSMIGIGSATRFSLEKSLGSEETAKYFTNSCLWALIASLPFVLAGLFGAEAILRMMGADAVILETGLTYTRIVLMFAPFFMINYTFTAFVRNDGAPNIAMAATLLSGVFNIIFDYIFMFPLGMKMVGAALATGLSPIVSMGICMAHYLSRRNTIRLVRTTSSVSKLLSACKLGVVALVGEISGGITTMVFNFILLGLVGNVAVAAYGVIANTALVGTALFNGVSQGLQPLASEVYGQADEESERRIYRHSLQIAGVLTAILLGIVFFGGDAIVDIFNSEQSAELASYAEVGIRIYFVGFVFACVNIVTAGFYSATGRSRESSIIAITRGVVAIVGFAFLLSRFFGVLGVWMAFPAAEILTLLVSLRMRTGQREI